MEAFSIKGVWWLPENPKRQAFGELTFDSREGCFLELFHFDDDPTDDFLIRFNNKSSGLQKHEIILGIDIKGHNITLYECMLIKGQRSLTTNISTKRFMCSLLYRGHHFVEYEDIKFRSVSTSYTYLEEWFDNKIFKNKEEYNPSGVLEHITIEYKIKNTAELQLSSFGVTFGTAFHRNSSRDNVSILKADIIKVESDHLIKYEQYLEEIISHIQHFICLGLGKALLPKQVTGRIEGIPFPIDIYYSALGSEIEQKPPSYTEILFRYEDVADNLQLYLENWLKLAQKVGSVIDLYFGLMYTNTYVTFQFLSLIQAIELYHREVYGGEYMSQDEFEPLRQQMLKMIVDFDISNDFKEKLKGNSHYFREYSLRKRLKDLLGDVLNDYQSLIQKVVGKTSDFTDKVVNTRNYYTHYSPTSKSNAVTDGKALYDMTVRLKIILQICFLKEIGMSQAKITELFERNQWFDWIIRQK